MGNTIPMKLLLTIVLLLPLFSYAQNCKLNKETDPYTKETKLSTGFIIFSGGSVTIDADSKEVDMLFPLKGQTGVLIIIPLLWFSLKAVKRK